MFDGFEYVEKDEFFDGDGCYDFTITVTKRIWVRDHSDTFSVVNSWEINWDSSNEDEEIKPLLNVDEIIESLQVQSSCSIS